MLLIEFDTNLNYGENILKYKNINDDYWHYLYIDIKTLNLLVRIFGIRATMRIPTLPISCDNLFTCRNIDYINYYGAEIEMYCGNNGNSN
jgi:hypothetical protein